MTKQNHPGTVLWSWGQMTWPFWSWTPACSVLCPLQMAGSKLSARKNPKHMLFLRLGISNVWENWHCSSLSDFATGKWQAGVQALALVLFCLVLWIPACVCIYVCTYMCISIHIMYWVHTTVFMLQYLTNTIHYITYPSHLQEGPSFHSAHFSSASWEWNVCLWEVALRYTKST